MRKKEKQEDMISQNHLNSSRHCLRVMMLRMRRMNTNKSRYHHHQLSDLGKNARQAQIIKNRLRENKN